MAISRLVPIPEDKLVEMRNEIARRLRAVLSDYENKCRLLPPRSDGIKRKDWFSNKVEEFSRVDRQENLIKIFAELFEFYLKESASGRLMRSIGIALNKIDRKFNLLMLNREALEPIDAELTAQLQAATADETRNERDRLFGNIAGGYSAARDKAQDEWVKARIAFIINSGVINNILHFREEKSEAAVDHDLGLPEMQRRRL